MCETCARAPARRSRRSSPGRCFSGLLLERRDCAALAAWLTLLERHDCCTCTRLPAPPAGMLTYHGTDMYRDAPHFEIAIAGAGFSGLGMAMALKKAGFEDFVVLERADDLGGTWRDNTYPGCACDIPSVLYSWTEEQNPN